MRRRTKHFCHHFYFSVCFRTGAFTGKDISDIGGSGYYQPIMSKQEALLKYGTSSIADIIPLDEASCKEIVNYCLSLSSDKLIQDHLIDILGVNSDSLSFIEEFLRLKNEPHTNRGSDLSSISYASAVNTDSQNPRQKHEVSQPKAHQNQLKSKLNNKTSITTSQLLEKPTPVESNSNNKVPKKKRVRNLNNLKDIEAAINELEISDYNSQSTANRICNCLATRHPLFELAPNCLNCGKIICSKEGLQPCSFCGASLISSKDRHGMLMALEQEKETLLKKGHTELDDSRSKTSGKSKKIVISMTSGENLWKAQDKAFKKAEEELKKNKEAKELQSLQKEDRFSDTNPPSTDIDPDLQKANERLETLLEFQETGAERTKIIDNAADYDSPHTGSVMWLSPMERALRLKVWQKQLKNEEATKAERSGRGEKSVEMVIKDGKVQMVEKFRVHKETDNKEIKELQDDIHHEKTKNEIQSLSTWDYENDKNKWEKPIYASFNQVTANSDNVDTRKSRVQFATSTNSDELVASLPS